jgi:hypothetical protein
MFENYGLDSIEVAKDRMECRDLRTRQQFLNFEKWNSVQVNWEKNKLWRKITLLIILFLCVLLFRAGLSGRAV